MGRPPKLTPQQQKEARRRAEGATLKELAKSYNVGRATISRLSRLRCAGVRCYAQERAEPNASPLVPVATRHRGPVMRSVAAPSRPTY